jgi:hypothetical protein
MLVESLHYMRMIVVPLVLFVLAPLSAQAQQTTESTATLSGRVVCADTNGPARFAKVYLKSTTPNKSNGDDFFSALAATPPPVPPGSPSKPAPKVSPEDAAERKANQANMARMMSALSDLMYSSTVGADGTYTFTNVKPGTYYVHATIPGYIDPLTAFTSEELTSDDPTIRQRIAAIASPITINGTEAAHADLRLERGASITGRILYDDGTPAAGWIVRIVHNSPAANPALLLPGGFDASDVDLSHPSEISSTDDTGRFRIAGLATGEYIVQARLIASSLGTSGFNPITTGSGSNALAARMGLRLTVYSGNALRLADAKPISVRIGDERSGMDIIMPLRALHSISGHVLAKADAHPVNAGTVELTGQDDAGKPDSSVHFVANIQSDGSFRFDYVPGPGTFTLKTSHAQDATTTSTKQVLASTIAEQKVMHSYGTATTTVQLADSDLDTINLVVPEQASTSQP